MDANGKALSEMPAFQPYWGKPAVRNERGGGGNVGIIRSPLRATTLPGSRVRNSLRDADAVGESGRPHRVHRYREVCQSPARSETSCTYADTTRGNREIPSPPRVAVALGRIGKSKDVRR